MVVFNVRRNDLYTTDLFLHSLPQSPVDDTLVAWVQRDLSQTCSVTAQTTEQTTDSWIV